MSDSESRRPSDFESPSPRSHRRFFLWWSLVLLAGVPLPLVGMIAFPAAAQMHTLLLLVVYGMAALWSVRRRSALRRLQVGAPFLILVLALPTLSVLWSESLGETVVGLMGLVGCVFLANWYASLPTSALLRAILAAAALVAGASLALVVLRPDIALFDALDPGALRGIAAHKNSLGRVVGLGVLAGTLLLLNGQHIRRRVLVPLALCAAALVLSRSATAQLATALALLVVVVVTLGRARNGLRMPALAGTTGLVVLGFRELARAEPWGQGLDPLGARFATGRGGVWSLALEAAAERPWFGHGYRAFWTGWDGPSHEILRALHWEPPHAHNGFLDVGLDLGLVGLLAVCFALLLVARWSSHPRVWRSAVLLWLLGLLTFVVAHNLGESSLLRPNDLVWTLFMALGLRSASERTGPGVETAPVQEERRVRR
jgi:exopolysaccharide production protein ExoQ